MRILIIGGGGREHVLAWKIEQSPLVKELYCAPGNGGISEIAQCVDIKADDIDGLVQLAKEKQIDLTVVGPEGALVAGIVDAFEKEGLKIFGPNKQAAQLEGSKIFSKEFMYECNIPTANFHKFDDIDKAKSFLNQALYPLVVKADGLAAGKGVIICKDLEEALKAVDTIMAKKLFKEAGAKILIEECLEGEEVSILAISDGENYCLLESSQDHKRIFDDDRGPNTGGMGAYSPHIKRPVHFTILYSTFFLNNMKYFWYEPGTLVNGKTFPLWKNLGQFAIERSACHMRNTFRYKIF